MPSTHKHRKKLVRWWFSLFNWNEIKITCKIQSNLHIIFGAKVLTHQIGNAKNKQKINKIMASIQSIFQFNANIKTFYNKFISWPTENALKFQRQLYPSLMKMGIDNLMTWISFNKNGHFSFVLMSQTRAVTFIFI